jgi:putative GTP pyrophosphokinase
VPNASDAQPFHREDVTRQAGRRLSCQTLDIRKTATMTEQWVDNILPKQRSLTQAVVSIVETVLQANHVDFISVTGRTKDRDAALEKIKRKGYRSPETELTDLSGIRVIAFSETDVKTAAALIEKTFEIDKANSLDQDSLLAANQLGYRSVHYVCKLGAVRSALPEFSVLAGLTFEVQIRTVLQHAWAELSHDRSYKFAGKLPREIERRIYLFAGMLEIADRGFDELARDIEGYASRIAAQSDAGEIEGEIDSISLPLFATSWAQKNKVELQSTRDNDNYADLVSELHDFGVRNLADLRSLEPNDYANHLRACVYPTTIYGLVRDWMLIQDWRRVARLGRRNWIIPEGEDEMLEHYISEEEWPEFLRTFSRT